MPCCLCRAARKARAPSQSDPIPKTGCQPPFPNGCKGLCVIATPIPLAPYPYLHRVGLNGRQRINPEMPTILIIDDSSTNRTIYSKLAATVLPDLQVVALEQPLEALAWLDVSRADLIITDYKMPGLDGDELIRRIREKEADGNTPIIVVTAYADRTYRMEALEAGATDFLLSPVDHFEFVTRARNLLKLSHQQELLQRRAEGLLEELQSSHRQQQIILRDSSAKLAQVIDTVPALISATDRAGNFVFVNNSHARFLGLSTGEITGRNVRDVLGVSAAETAQALDRIVLEHGVSMPGHEHDLVSGAGTAHAFYTTRTPLRDNDGAVIGVLTTSVDISERRAAEARLRHLAHHDPLTGLPNRTLLQDTLDQAVCCSRGKQRFALHLIDLDRFKAVNDGLGHYVGDQVLVSTAHRLKEIVGDADTVARLGGDEFAILQQGVSAEADAAQFAGRITAALSRQFTCSGHDISVGASVGVAVYPDDGADAENLLRRSDLAMYKAKAADRGTWRFFVADMDQEARAAMEVQEDLRAGLARNEFVLHYQPQIDLATQRMVGAEALLRWQRPGYGLLRPAAFLRIAEETGLIVPISAWVMREACRQSMRWQAAGLGAIRVAVNVSAVQLRRQNLSALVAEVLSETKLAPELLDLELTESMLIEDTSETIGMLRTLRGLGVRLSVDDFGTGYSSLSMITRFPVSCLKIDQSFTRGLGKHPSDAAIIRTILELAETLKLDVLAEGVETHQQMHHLLVSGCREAQGYLFGAPIEADILEGLMRQGTRRFAESAS